MDTVHASGFNQEEVKNTLLGDFDLVAQWFYENGFILNAVTLRFLVAGEDGRGRSAF